MFDIIYIMENVRLTLIQLMMRLQDTCITQPQPLAKQEVIAVGCLKVIPLNNSYRIKSTYFLPTHLTETYCSFVTCYSLAQKQEAGGSLQKYLCFI